MTWRDFWNAETSLYVNDRHREVHYADVATEIVRLVPHPQAIVLDVGCGEALFADRVADACGHLYLCEASDLVRGRLQQRFRAQPTITVLAAEEVAALPPGGLDLIVVNSVAQYLTPQEFRDLVGLLGSRLAPTGSLAIADIIPPSVGPAVDALALLRYGAANGFAMGAAIGLFRTLFSDYRRKRAELGLAKYTYEEIVELLRGQGLSGERRSTNLGHNQSRMTVIARLL